MSRHFTCTIALVPFAAAGVLLASTGLGSAAPAPPAEGYVTVENGIRLHYRVLGRGNDVVVIPGDVWWGSRADALANGRRVVLYDPRARGRSDAVKDPALIGMEHEIRDLEAVRAHFSLSRMSLVGWSYLGGMVALYAAEHPERVEAVVQVGPIPFKKHPHFDDYLKSRAERSDATADRQLEQMRQAGLPERDPVQYCRAYWDAILRAMLAKPDTSGVIPAGVCECVNERPESIGLSVASLFGGLGNWDWSSRLAAVKARVLVVHGSHDNIPLESSRDWARALPNARLLVLDASGHYPFAEQPAEFTRAVDTFLRSTWPQGAVRP